MKSVWNMRCKCGSKRRKNEIKDFRHFDTWLPCSFFNIGVHYLPHQERMLNLSQKSSRLSFCYVSLVFSPILSRHDSQVFENLLSSFNDEPFFPLIYLPKVSLSFFCSRARSGVQMSVRIVTNFLLRLVILSSLEHHNR